MPTDARTTLLARIGDAVEARDYVSLAALLLTFEAEARADQQQKDAEILERERDSIDTCCDALLLHAKRAILRGGEEPS